MLNAKNHMSKVLTLIWPAKFDIYTGLKYILLKFKLLESVATKNVI